MKLILVGNFAPDAQQSMLRYAQLLLRELPLRELCTTLVAPRPHFARLCRPYRYSGWPKLLGYLDKFVLFPRELRRLARREPGAVFHLLDHANAVYLPHLPARTVITCHDLLQIRAALGEFPQQRLGRSGRRYQEWILRNLARAPLTACVSWKTRRDLLRLTPLSPARVTVVPLGLNHDYRRLDPGVAWSRLAGQGPVAAPLAPGDPFLLNVGGGQWYKNRPGLLRIFAALRTQHRYQGRLVVVGKPLSAVETAIADELSLTPHLVSLQNVPNPILEALYSVADGLVFPSWEEGLGWPLLEAQACGCPVFTSERAPMTEVAGEAAVYFDPADPAAAAQIVAAALRNSPSLAEAGYENVQRFTTTAMIDGYIELYGKVAAPA
jgi:glycosyltransferase involved in cell wall biosynthesis